jgi:hypothetical protein
VHPDIINDALATTTSRKQEFEILRMALPCVPFFRGIGLLSTIGSNQWFITVSNCAPM